MPTAEEIVHPVEDGPPSGESPWVGGAVPETDIEIAAYDPAWPASFQVLADRIHGALGWRALQVDHVGSTSVPGLPARPVIDIDLIVADAADEPAWLPQLEAVGFELRIRERWWYEHRGLRHLEPRCNLHVWGPEAPEPIRHRIFREWLHGNPEELALYRDTKVAAAEAANERGEHVMEYNQRKERVIREIYERAFRATGLLG